MNRTKVLTIDTRYLMAALDYVQINVMDGYDVLNNSYYKTDMPVDEQLKLIRTWMSELSKLSVGNDRLVHVIDNNTYVTMLED